MEASPALQDEPKTAATGGVPQPVAASIQPLFSTWLYQCRDGPRQLDPELAALARRLMADPAAAAARSNRGGWHSADDLFRRDEPVVGRFRELMEQHVQGFLNHFRPPERRRRDRFRLAGWLNVNRAGDSNVLHCHPGAFVSAVYYVEVPPAMQGGEIVFRDPRGPAPAMYETPSIELPWVGTGMGLPIVPASGLLLIFPAWLEHRVEPFAGPGERISVAFNASNP